VVSVRRCRELLGANCPETDLEIELLRDQLMLLANAALEAAALDKGLRMNAEETRLQIAERAAIIEFDGEIERAKAEDSAFQSWAKKIIDGDSVN
jgi:hypothetical protein